MSKQIPSYGKVMTLGSVYTDNALNGEIIIQEKVDGSQFKFGLNAKKEVVIDSKNQAIHVESPGMFEDGVAQVLKNKKLIKKFEPNTWFYAEYLRKPKHNIVVYKNIPKNNIVLFDAVSEARWATREELEVFADALDIDIIPELWRGTIFPGGYTDENMEFLREFWKTTSYLEGADVEGIVIKNYGQTVLIGGNVYPLFTKLVNPQFQEKMKVSARAPKVSIDLFIRSFANENRWRKAMEFVRDEGKLLGEPKDIGAIIQRVLKDVIEEEKENIKEWFYNHYIKNIKGAVTSGLPSWYKALLIKKRIDDENINTGKHEAT